MVRAGQLRRTPIPTRNHQRSKPRTYTHPQEQGNPPGRIGSRHDRGTSAATSGVDGSSSRSSPTPNSCPAGSTAPSAAAADSGQTRTEPPVPAPRQRTGSTSPRTRFASTPALVEQRDNESCTAAYPRDGQECDHASVYIHLGRDETATHRSLQGFGEAEGFVQLDEVDTAEFDTREFEGLARTRRNRADSRGSSSQLPCDGASCGDAPRGSTPSSRPLAPHSRDQRARPRRRLSRSAFPAVTVPPSHGRPASSQLASRRSISGHGAHLGRLSLQAPSSSVERPTPQAVASVAVTSRAKPS